MFTNTPVQLDVTDLLSKNMTSVVVERSCVVVEEIHLPNVFFGHGSILSKNLYSFGETLAFVNIPRHD